ncbi:MAG: hypothetical protein KGJ94_05105 [Xanthomonadaceae bacterium]|nr:hypothetical protein [Xanthomonadaceae bacterium]
MFDASDRRSRCSQPKPPGRHCASGHPSHDDNTAFIPDMPEQRVQSGTRCLVVHPDAGLRRHDEERMRSWIQQQQYRRHSGQACAAGAIQNPMVYACLDAGLRPHDGECNSHARR